MKIVVTGADKKYRFTLYVSNWCKGIRSCNTYSTPLNAISAGQRMIKRIKNSYDVTWELGDL